MAKYIITWMPGDGVGKEVLDATKLILDQLNFDADYIEAEIGWSCWEKYKDPLPPHTIDALKNSNCAMMGAITSYPFVPGYVSPVIKLRQYFDLYKAIRRFKSFEGNPLNYNDSIDFIIFRENTEGLYCGIEFEQIPDIIKDIGKDYPKYKLLKNLPEDASISLRVITPYKSRRIIQASFEYAKEHNRKKVTCIHKANILRATDGLFLNTFNEIAKEYPGIMIEEQNVDAAAMWLIKKPASYDVIVTTNLFGDILSDEAAQLVGGLGFVPSSNIGDSFAVFEPAHGSVSKYAGKNIINPIASILSAQMMLEWLGEHKIADRIIIAVSKVIKEGKVLTQDMGGTNSTMDMANAIAKIV